MEGIFLAEEKLNVLWKDLNGKFLGWKCVGFLNQLNNSNFFQLGRMRNLGPSFSFKRVEKILPTTYYKTANFFVIKKIQ